MLVGFVVGGVLGAIAFGAFGVAALYISAAVAALKTVLYWIRSREHVGAAATP